MDDEKLDALDELGAHIAAQLGAKLLARHVVNGELAIEIPTDALSRTIKFLRDDANCLFKGLMDICGVDYPEQENRFEIVYNLLSYKHNQRIRIKHFKN